MAWRAWAPAAAEGVSWFVVVCHGAQARLPQAIAEVHDTRRRAAAGRCTTALTCRGALHGVTAGTNNGRSILDTTLTKAVVGLLL